MRESIKKNLETLSKEQLIYIIDKFDHFYTIVGETCVSESKWNITSADAMKNIRKYCCDIQYDIDILNENIMK